MPTLRLIKVVSCLLAIGAGTQSGSAHIDMARPLLAPRLASTPWPLLGLSKLSDGRLRRYAACASVATALDRILGADVMGAGEGRDALRARGAVHAIEAQRYGAMVNHIGDITGLDEPYLATVRAEADAEVERSRRQMPHAQLMAAMESESAQCAMLPQAT
jgi:hypothetical protein